MGSYAIVGTDRVELESQNNGSGSSWADAYDGLGSPGVSDVSSGDIGVGAFISSSNKQVRVAAVEFVTSTIPDDEIPVAATLTVRRGSSFTADWGGRDLEVYQLDYGAAPATPADWRTRAQLAAERLVGTTSMEGAWSVGTDRHIPLDLIVPAAWVNVAGVTQLLLTSEMHRTGEILPADPDYVIALEDGVDWVLTIETVPATFEPATPVTIEEILRGDVPQYRSTARFIILDHGLNELFDISPIRPSATIELDTTARVKRRLTGLRLPPEEISRIDVFAHRLLVNWVIEFGDVQQVFPFGVFMFSDLATRRTTGGDIGSIDTMTDQTVIIDQPSLTSFTVARGGSLRDAWIRSAEDANVAFFDIDDSEARAGGRLAWPVGHNLADRMAGLASRLGFVQYFDNRGVLRARKQGTRWSTPELRYGPGEKPVLRHSPLESTDVADAPTHWLAIGGGTDAPVVGVYEEPRSAPYSQAHRGFRVVRQVDAAGVATTTGAEAYAEHAASSDVAGYRWIEIDTIPDPRIDLHQVVGWEGRTLRLVSGQLPLKPGGPWELRLREVYEP